MLASAFTSWSNWLGLIGSCVTVGGLIWWLVRFMHKRFVEQVIAAITPVREAVTPNSGSSMLDAINRIEIETNRQGAELDALTLKVEKHLAYHEGQAAGMRAV
jgi:hypothetical protein